MLAPSVPIDKNKQGGRNYDASKMTDFKKIGTISKADTSKIVSGTKNQDPRTNNDEQRRSAIMISALRTIPRAFCSVCPNTIQTTIATQSLASDAITSLTGVTFFVMYYDASLSGYNLYYSNYGLYIEDSLNFLLTNSAATFGVYNYYIYPRSPNSADSLSGLSSISNPTRNDVINVLNNVLSKASHSFNSSKLVASLDSTGRLVLSISGNQLPAAGTHTPPYLAGLFFGNSPNGSTALGVTNTNGKNGVDGAALVISEGQTSVTAPFIIADPNIDFS